MRARWAGAALAALLTVGCAGEPAPSPPGAAGPVEVGAKRPLAEPSGIQPVVRPSAAGVEPDGPLHRRSPASPAPPGVVRSSDPTPTPAVAGSSTASTPADPSGVPTGPEPPVEPFTLAVAGDVNFFERTKPLLADPAAAFGAAIPGLQAADLTMLNLESAVTNRGERLPKPYAFHASGAMFRALEAAGVDVVSMANNHAVDFGDEGLADTLDALDRTEVVVVGLGQDDAAAYAPYRTTVRGVPVSIFAASAVPDITLERYSAGPGRAGIADAHSPLLLDGVRAAADRGDAVVVYLHWGANEAICPDATQQDLADRLAAAGASAVVGTHAHRLQGAGWRPDGTYVAYGLGNYLWWRSFDNHQDDTGVLTLTFTGNRVTGSSFAPARINDRGQPVPVTGAVAEEILGDLETARGCSGLAAVPPG